MAVTPQGPSWFFAAYPHIYLPQGCKHRRISLRHWVLIPDWQTDEVCVCQGTLRHLADGNPQRICRRSCSGLPFKSFGKDRDVCSENYRVMFPEVSTSTFDILQGGNIIQHLEIHTSCSKPLNLGDDFGSLRVVGFTYIP